MWTSERSRALPAREAEAELGLVTLGGDPAGVLLGGERRWLPVYSPGGLCWRPAPGDRVLVLKAGAERESPCILGKVQEERDLAPGELLLSCGSSALRLGLDGLGLEGRVKINGEPLEDYIKRVSGSSSAEGGES